MQRSMRGFLHRRERKKTNVVRLAHFFERPANAHVTRQSLAAIGRPFKGGNGGDHWKAPGDCMTPLCVTMLTASADLRKAHWAPSMPPQLPLRKGITTPRTGQPETRQRDGKRTRLNHSPKC